MASEIVYGESRCRLGPGDLLVVYTDGVTEATNAHGQFFSEDRIGEIVRGASMSGDAIVARLLEAVDDFADTAEPADDITVLALHVPSEGREDTVLAERVVLRNQPSDLGVLETMLDRFSERSGLPQPTMSEIRIVCDELVSNVIAYAYPNGGLHEIEVHLRMAGRRLTVTVADDGIPFDPLAVAPPDTTLPLAEREVGGLGIHLVRHLVDDVIYRRIGTRNETTLVKDVAGE